MFLIPLIHTQYSACTHITSFDNIISIPSIRGGSPSPSPSSSSTIVSCSSNPSASPSIPTKNQLVAERKEQLARNMMAFSRQVYSASFSSNASTVENFDDWLNQVQELKRSIITRSFPSSN